MTVLAVAKGEKALSALEVDQVNKSVTDFGKLFKVMLC